jgi:Uma2 family endonuclease
VVEDRISAILVGAVYREKAMMTAQDYERTAQEYLAALPMEHFMESTPQSRQREITFESFAILKTRIPSLQYFGELLMQYEDDDGTLVQVVPDNMVILSDEPARARSSFPIRLEKAKPFWVLEYASANNKKKDYEQSFQKYEDVLQVPYCLIFDPETSDLRLWRYNGEGYVRMEPDAHGRFRIDELDLELGLLDGWLRYWHRGELLPLPAELQQDRDRLRSDLAERNRELHQQADVVQHLKELQAEQTDQMNQVTSLLRRQVEERARRASREDILGRLPATSDLMQLTAWLGELP